jgi:hypothetical protein
VGRLKAVKSLDNPARRRERMIGAPPRYDAGKWFIDGFVGEFTSDQPPERGYVRVCPGQSVSWDGRDQLGSEKI